jgi:PAS domain S-box-containing protein
MPQDDDIKELRRRLEEAEETLRAIRSGEVDALVVEGPEGERVYTLEGADYTYRALVEAIQQGAVSLTTDGTVLYCNCCFADMIKAPHEKVIGASISTFLPPSERSTFEIMLRQCQGGKAQRELQFQASDGTLLPVFVALAPLLMAESNALCMVVADLTEQKKNQDLQTANRRKDEFLAMLAHELRNPLAPIQNAVSVLQHLGLVDEKLTFATEVIGRQVHHLSRLVDDLLDVSRITLGKIKLQKEPVELATIIARAVETSRPLIDPRGHRLTLALPPERLRVEADATRLTQVIGNLLTNAAKYTDDGGEIALTTNREGSEIVVCVRDTGMGMAPDLLPHVFDLFTQGDRSLARSEGGLGIGLTLVRRLVELHGGMVEAHSDGPGRGSEVLIRLPVLGEELQPVDRGHRSEEPSGSAGRRVLIVEDNIDGAGMLAMLLKLMGHQVSVAHSGTEALKAADVSRPEVVLLDIGLPGMNGYEVAKRLRAQPDFANTVLIAMTGYGQEEDKQQSRAAGFNHHLVKPVGREMLQLLLESLASPRAAKQ